MIYYIIYEVEDTIKNVVIPSKYLFKDDVYKDCLDFIRNTWEQNKKGIIITSIDTVYKNIYTL